MNNEILTIISSISIALITAVSTVAGAYWIFKGRLREIEATENVAQIGSHESIAKMQREYADAYNLLADQATRPIEKLQLRVNELEKSDMEKSKRIAMLEKELAAVREENARLKKRIDRIRKEVQTGPLSSGVHKIPKDNE